MQEVSQQSGNIATVISSYATEKATKNMYRILREVQLIMQ